MSGSKLEEALYGQMWLLAMEEGSTFPMPVREIRFDWCCEHPERVHYLPPHCDACCNDVGPDPGLPPICEHTYARGRKWRFDFAWPALKIAAEVEGGTYSGGRHVRGSGFEKDTEKYNRAVELGWQVLRYTRRQVTSGEALVQIERALKACAGELTGEPVEGGD